MKKLDKEKFETDYKKQNKTLYDISPETINNMSPEDIKELINDLQVQKFELEAQNEELRRAQLEIEESRNRYNDLFDFAPIGYFTFNKEGLITELNFAASKMLEVERRYLINKSFYNFLSDDCIDYFREYLKKVFDTNLKQVSEIKLYSKKGAVIFAQMESVTISKGFDTIESCRTAVIDVTKRKQAEEAYKEGQRFIQSISAATPSIIYLYDIQENKYTYINKAFGTILGYDKDAMGPLENSLLTSIYHPEDLIKWEERSGRFYNIEDKEVIESEFRIRNATGDWVWLYAKEVLFSKNPEGEPRTILGIALDITDLKKIEYKLIEKNEELSKTNADLDRFVYSVSHDLRAPLNSVVGLINVTKMGTIDKQTEQYLDLMVKSIKKLDLFIQDLINFSRNSRLAVDNQIIDFKDIIKEIFDGLKYFEGSEKVEKILNVNVTGEFYSDRTQLHIILSNIISNAIRYHNYSRTEPYVAVYIKSENEKVIIEVKDNGQGIGEEHLSKIFDVFYRVSNNKDSSGLGLYIVKEALNKLNGVITVKSVLNQGSCFIIEIPNKFTQ